MIYRATQAVGGNAAGILQYVEDNGYSYDQLVELHGELMQEIGKKQAPDAQEAGKLREEVTRLKAELERLTGTRGKGSPSAGGREGTARGLPTITAWQAMTLHRGLARWQLRRHGKRGKPAQPPRSPRRSRRRG